MMPAPAAIVPAQRMSQARQRVDFSKVARRIIDMLADGLTDRVFPRLNNSFDYAVQVAAAIQADNVVATVSATAASSWLAMPNSGNSWLIPPSGLVTPV